MVTKKSNLRKNKPRFFTSCDCARVARNVVTDQNISPESVIACTAKGFGFTELGLSRRAIGPVSGVEQQIDDIKSMLGLALVGFVRPDLGPVKTGFIRGVITKLVQMTPLGKVIAAAAAAYAMLEALQQEEEKKKKECECKPVDEWIEPGTCNCKY